MEITIQVPESMLEKIREGEYPRAIADWCHEAIVNAVEKADSAARAADEFELINRMNEA